jgi:hypothetical protein
MKNRIMQTALIFLITAAALLSSPRVSTAAGSDFFGNLSANNYQNVLDKISSEIVASLPDDIHFRLLAIPPIQGDDGQLADALTAKIKSGTRYHLIERRDLDKLLKEQGIQLSPVADPRRPIEPGKIKGVEGLLLGKVEESTCNFLFCSLRVFIKLDNVERGDVVFAKHYEASAFPSALMYLGIALLVVLVVAVFIVLGKRNAMKRGVRFSEDDSQALQGLQAEVKKARDNLNIAHDTLISRSRIQLGTELRSARESVNALLFKLEQAPGVYPGSADKKDRSALEAHGRSMAALMRNILAESEKLLSAVKSGDDRATGDALKALNTEIKNASNRLHDRHAGKA